MLIIVIYVITYWVMTLISQIFWIIPEFLLCRYCALIDWFRWNRPTILVRVHGDIGNPWLSRDFSYHEKTRNTGFPRPIRILEYTVQNKSKLENLSSCRNFNGADTYRNWPFFLTTAKMTHSAQKIRVRAKRNSSASYVIQ